MSVFLIHGPGGSSFLFRKLLPCSLFAISICLSTASLDAQNRRTRIKREANNPVPQQSFNDPSKFFDRLFGEESEQDEKGLAKIRISLREENQFGETAAKAYLDDLKRRKIRVLSRGKDVEYVRRLVKLLWTQLENHDRYRNVKVFVADSPRTDAFCFPGGTIIVFRGMLDYAESEAALVGVIGHELSHLDNGHQLVRLKRMKLARQKLSGNGKQFNPRNFLSVGRSFMRIWSKPFSPEDELEADHDGAWWAYRVGYNPNAMAAMFLRLDRRDRDKKNAGPAFLQTHPFHIDRYRAIEALYKELQAEQPRENLYVGKENLRRRITRDEQRFPE